MLNSSYAYLKKRFPDRVANFFPDDALAMSDREGDKILHATFRDTYIEADWIYNTLQRLQPPDLSRVCILIRSNAYNKKLSAYYRRQLLLSCFQLFAERPAVRSFPHTTLFSL